MKKRKALSNGSALKQASTIVQAWNANFGRQKGTQEKNPAAKMNVGRLNLLF